MIVRVEITIDGHEETSFVTAIREDQIVVDEEENLWVETGKKLQELVDSAATSASEQMVRLSGKVEKT